MAAYPARPDYVVPTGDFSEEWMEGDGINLDGDHGVIRRIADACASHLLVPDNHGYRLPAASQTARSSISSSSLPLVSGTRKKTKRRDSSAKTA